MQKLIRRKKEKKKLWHAKNKNNEQKASNSIHPLATTPEKSINTKSNVP